VHVNLFIHKQENAPNIFSHFLWLTLAAHNYSLSLYKLNKVRGINGGDPEKNIVEATIEMNVVFVLISIRFIVMYGILHVLG
jgi:hypothetical protein